MSLENVAAVQVALLIEAVVDRGMGVDDFPMGRSYPPVLLAPDIVEAIPAGRQPVELTVSRLKRIGGLPVSWAGQRQIPGFA